SRDGRLVLTVNGNQALLWDAATGERLAVLPMEAPVILASFSPSGDRLLTATETGAVGLWEASGRQLGVLRGHESAVVSVQTGPGGTLLATASHDGTARVWDVAPLRLPPPLLGTCVEARTGTTAPPAGEVRGLTATEWQARHQKTILILREALAGADALPAAGALLALDGDDEASLAVALKGLRAGDPATVRAAAAALRNV